MVVGIHHLFLKTRRILVPPSRVSAVKGNETGMFPVVGLSVATTAKQMAFI